MKYTVTHYANFGSYYVVVFEINGFYVYVIIFKDEKNDFCPATLSSPIKDFSVISERFELVPYSKSGQYGDLINALISVAEKKFISRIDEIEKEIDFYIEKEMSQLNMF